MSTQKINNIKELCEYIWYLEKKYDLFNLEIAGVHPWAAYRMDIYYELGKIFDVFDKNHSMKLSKKEKLINLCKISYHYLKNLNNYNDNAEVLIFSHNRSKLINNQYIDPYTYYLKKKNY